jgi:hypothetical protein
VMHWYQNMSQTSSATSNSCHAGVSATLRHQWLAPASPFVEAV